MGKGTRNRQVHAEDKASNPQKYVKKKQAPKWLGSVLLAVVAVVLVAVIVLSTLSSNGVIRRTQTAMKTADYEVNGSVMTYFTYTIYNSYVNYYYQFFQYYSSYLGEGTTFEDYLGFDTSVSLKKQVKDEKTGETWFTYFSNQARDEVEKLLIYCQAAKAAGIALDDEDYKAIDASIESIKATATTSGYPNFKSYLAQNYGKGIIEKDLRQAMELQQLAAKYQEKLQNDYTDAAKAEDVEKFFGENKNDYLSVDYLSYVFTAKKDSVATDATDEQKTAATEKYEAAKKAISETANTLSAKETEEEFRAYVKVCWEIDNAESYKTKYYEDYLKDAEGETDEEKAEAAQKKLDEKLAEDAEAKVQAMLTEKKAYADGTDAEKWMFNTEKEKTGKTFKYEDNSKDSEGTFTVTVYFMVREPSRDETITRNIAFLILPGASYTEDEAKAAKDLFSKGTVSKDALIAFGDTYDKKTNCNSTENVKEGAFGLDEVDEWLFDAERKAGDYELITATSDDTKYYVLVYVDGMGDAYWYVDCKANMVTKELEDWYEEAEKTYAVTVNDSVIAGIDL